MNEEPVKRIDYRLQNKGLALTKSVEEPEPTEEGRGMEASCAREEIESREGEENEQRISIKTSAIISIERSYNKS